MFPKKLPVKNLPWKSFYCALTALSSGCDLTASQNSALGDALLTQNQTPILPDDSLLPSPSCFVERFVQPQPDITRKVDILFVIDSSGSLNSERQSVADGMNAFVGALGSEVDYQAAVVLAHGPQSSRYGKLYKKSTEPTVLASSQMSLSAIQSALRTKMTTPATDSSTDGGEVGLLALRATLDSTRFATIQSQGFYRSDAAWVVVFISDEQDICYSYAAGTSGVYDPERTEASGKTRFCTRQDPDAATGVMESITPATVLAKLKEKKPTGPLVVSGVLYNQLGHVPSSGENEYGYGYMDLIQLAQGFSINLADGIYNQGLETLGSLATVTQVTLNEFALARPNIDSASIEVLVDGVAASSEYRSDSNSVFLPSPGQSLSVVDMKYCLQPELPPSGCSGASCDSIGL